MDAIDIHPLACSLSKQRGVNVVQGSITALPFPDDCFDFVVSIDVLYHQAVNNDESALSEISRVLKPGGHLLLRVPAIPKFRTLHDEHVHTRQRYDRAELAAKIAGAGFRVTKVSFIGLPLIPAVWVKSLTQARTSNRSESGVKPVPRILNRFIYALLAAENLLVSKVSLPIGIGLFAVGRNEK